MTNFSKACVILKNANIEHRTESFTARFYGNRIIFKTRKDASKASKLLGAGVSRFFKEWSIEYYN